MMLDKVQRLYGDRKPSNIIVRQVSANPYVFSWTNDTLTKQSCPKDHIRRLFNVLIDSSDSIDGNQLYGSPSPRLKKLLEGKVYIKNVTMKYLGTCLYDEEANAVSYTHLTLPTKA